VVRHQPSAPIKRNSVSRQRPHPAVITSAAGGRLDDQIVAAIEDRTAGAALVRALQGGRDAVTRGAAEALSTGDPAPLSQLAAILVAERGGQLVAALCAVPPVAFIGQLMERGLDPPHAIVTSLAMMKIEAVAVDPAYRGQGIASALLGGCVALLTCWSICCCSERSSVAPGWPASTRPGASTSRRRATGWTWKSLLAGRAC
jgi:GNAT superfamily N-acetyltransferase